MDVGEDEADGGSGDVDDVWRCWLWRCGDADDAGHMAIAVTITVKISHALAMARVVAMVLVAIVDHMTLTVWWQSSDGDMLMSMRCSV